MPKLKAALAHHQHNAARFQAEKRKRENAEAVGYTKVKKKSAAGSAAAAAAGKAAQGPGQGKAAPTTTLSSGKGAPDTAVATTSAETSTAVHRGPKRRPTIPIDKKDTILLLGEANFSFARSLLRAPHNIRGRNITATSYDTEEVCLQKYPDAEEILEELRKEGVKVCFEVDGGDLEATFGKIRPGKEHKDARHGFNSEDIERGKKRKEKVGKKGYWSRIIFNFPHVGESLLSVGCDARLAVDVDAPKTKADPRRRYHRPG